VGVRVGVNARDRRRPASISASVKVGPNLMDPMVRRFRE
jgi:hypothetical protein